MSNKDRKIWLNGEIVPVIDAKINVLSPTAQFGANVFEGIRCYWNEGHQQLYAFRLKEHYQRLQNSIRLINFEDRYSANEMESYMKAIVRANYYREDIAIRQTIFLDGLGSWSSQEPTGMFIAPIPKGRAYDKEKRGLGCCISSWERIHDNDLSPRIKVGANYMNSRSAQLEAMKNGYDSAIFLNRYRKVCEAPGSCLFMIRDQAIITPPVTASILESITRNTVIEIANKECGLKVVEREIDRTELYIADEIFLCGTAMEIMPILSIDRFIINGGQMGEITEKLRNLYFQIVRGNYAAYMDWLTPIYE